MRNEKTFRRTISIFIHKSISIFTICAHISLYFFFRKKIIRFTKKPFLFVKHYIITYVHSNIQNDGSSVGNGLNRYTARSYIPDQQNMSYYTAASLYHHQYISPEASLKSIHIYSNILYYVYKLY